MAGRSVARRRDRRLAARRTAGRDDDGRARTAEWRRAADAHRQELQEAARAERRGRGRRGVRAGAARSPEVQRRRGDAAEVGARALGRWHNRITYYHNVVLGTVGARALATDHRPDYTSSSASARQRPERQVAAEAGAAGTTRPAGESSARCARELWRTLAARWRPGHGRSPRRGCRRNLARPPGE